MAKPRLNVKLPAGARIVIYVTDANGQILYVVYVDPVTGKVRIIANSSGAKPII